MKRDELYEDPAGERWRISEIQSYDLGAGSKISSVVVRHISGITATLDPGEIKNWKRLAGDPLVGKRREIANGLGRLIYPANRPCPVEQGERFALQSVEIVVERVRRKLVKGREAEWHVELLRREVERPRLLRATPPAHADHSRDGDLDADGIRKAAIESAYTSSPVAALSNEPESVGPDWRDRTAEARELNRLEARRERVSNAQIQAEVDRLAARLKQTGRTLGDAGHDPSEMLDEIRERLAREIATLDE